MNHHLLFFGLAVADPEHQLEGELLNFFCSHVHKIEENVTFFPISLKGVGVGNLAPSWNHHCGLAATKWSSSLILFSYLIQIKYKINCTQILLRDTNCQILDLKLRKLFLKFLFRIKKKVDHSKISSSTRLENFQRYYAFEAEKMKKSNFKKQNSRKITFCLALIIDRLFKIMVRPEILFLVIPRANIILYLLRPKLQFQDKN